MRSPKSFGSDKNMLFETSAYQTLIRKIMTLSKIFWNSQIYIYIHVFLPTSSLLSLLIINLATFLGADQDAPFLFPAPLKWCHTSHPQPWSSPCLPPPSSHMTPKDPHSHTHLNTQSSMSPGLSEIYHSTPFLNIDKNRQYKSNQYPRGINEQYPTHLYNPSAWSGGGNPID